LDKSHTQSTAQKILWLLKHRPGHLYQTARGLILFHWSRCSRNVVALNGVTLAENVRLQKNSSLMAESPSAKITVGENSIIYEDARIEAYGGGAISIGADSIIGDAHIVCRYSVQIGKRFLSSWNVFIQDYDSHPTEQSLRQRQVEGMIDSFQPRFVNTLRRIKLAPEEWSFPGEDIIIGDDVWLGAGVTVLKGAQIGAGSIVATGAVVLKGNYPANSLIAGNPAKVVKSLTSPAS